MNEVSIIGIDLAKSVFQLHGAGPDGSVVFRKKLSRAKLPGFLARQPRCIVAMEACGGAHHWGREIGALGHEVRLIPPQYVKPYVKRQKNDAADAEAITEAASRPTMRFVAVKTAEKQGEAMRLKVRDLLVGQRTQTINALRGHLSEHGLVAPQGTAQVGRLAKAVDDHKETLPASVVGYARLLLKQIEGLDGEIAALTREVERHVRADGTARRLTAIPGVGPLTAAMVLAFAPPLENFRKGRDFSAWLGLVPEQDSSGGKTRLGEITRAGQRDLRRILVCGAMAVIRWAVKRGTSDPWLARILARGKPRKVVAVALANRTARVIWALLSKGTDYKAPGQTV